MNYTLTRRQPLSFLQSRMCGKELRDGYYVPWHVYQTVLHSRFHKGHPKLSNHGRILGGPWHDAVLKASLGESLVGNNVRGETDTDSRCGVESEFLPTQVNPLV